MKRLQIHPHSLILSFDISRIFENSKTHLIKFQKNLWICPAKIVYNIDDDFGKSISGNDRYHAATRKAYPNIIVNRL